jgi:hypothetical protein
VLHDSHCRRTFLPSSFSVPEDPKFREEEREPPAGVAGATPDAFPDDDDAAPSVPWRERTISDLFQKAKGQGKAEGQREQESIALPSHCSYSASDASRTVPGSN